jgi:hypothetical protein
MAVQVNPTPVPARQAPSVASLVTAVAIALVAASVLLVTVILPAEYGFDPLGTGEALGLTALAGTTAIAPVAPLQGDKQIPVQEGHYALYPAQYKFDSREFTLGPYEYIEYKYRLEQGATMLFSWAASDDVMHDFHGVPDGSTTEQSYDNRSRRRADGSFAAPFAGIHGWYWENPGGDTITVRLTTAGYYTAAHEFHSDRSRFQRELRDVDTLGIAEDEKENP